MIKRNTFKIMLSSILISTTLFSFVPYKILCSIKEPINNSSEISSSIHLILDNDTYDVLPSKFRKSSDLQTIANNSDINTDGLENLNISGSQQFSKMNLPILLNAISTKLPIIDYDLRQESHGFVNGLPISFENQHNNANKGLTDAEVLKKEKEQLSSIKIGSSLTFYNKPDKTIIPEEVIDEQTLVTSNNIKYVRIFATDEVLPDNPVIDSFVESIKNINEESWLHFHCKEGIGRTTAFMIFYDMMKNYKDVSAEDIINRQIQLTDFDSDDIRLITSERRIKLYNAFYNYCKEYGDEFKVTFTDYAKANNLLFQ